ncbi:MAG: RsmD family RNA methyltransferase [SAR202 cluster bacterium]|nr:RsmD family RNA methyltransferase [SAR202 cluster bacterium]|tara:strand:- start:180 stop:1397 length:1218 start_codon:yes stop_codon:yes gene_type:complete
MDIGKIFKPTVNIEKIDNLELLGITSNGDTYANYKNETINVFGGIPGETVSIYYHKFNKGKKQIISGFVEKVIKESPYRITAPCNYFGQCTGCQWQHIEYSHQLTLKKEIILNEINKYPALAKTKISDVIPSESEFNYRNHARFTIRDKGSIGFINRISRRFIKIENCQLMNNWINKTISQLQNKVQETSQMSIRYGTNSNDWLIQPKLNSNRINLPTGQSHYTEKLFDKTFRIGSPSFFQVNTTQAEKLISLVISKLNTNTNLIIDAYAGVGTFAITLSEFAKNIIAIEESKSALKDAIENINNIENIEFIQGKTEDILASLDVQVDTLILDPPRAGCHVDTLKGIINNPPEKIIYVSCDPKTLMRDLELLTQSNFKLISLDPIDMFPQTHHVECVATLLKIKN